MNIAANNVASKLFVAFVAVAMLFMVAAPAKAATVEELQAQIAALMAQISGLSGGSSAPAAGCMFTRALTTGSTGADVTCLQNYLIGGGFGISAGATGYFGSQTASAVASWQAANGVTPAAGYFGPVSQAKYNALMAMNGGGSTPGGDDSGSGSDNTLSGEADLDSAELQDGDSSIEEGDSEVEVAELTLEFNDGDAEVSRLDISLTPDDSVDPWDVFESFSLWVDGDMVAEVNADDEDDYLDEDDGSLRFSGLDLFAEEDEELVITIAATVQGNVDTDDLTDWDLMVDSIRYFDADGVATTEDNFDDIGNETVTFEMETAGADEGIDLSLASSNPDSTDIVVDTDSDTDDVTIMVAELEAQDNDIELNRVVVKVDTTMGTTSDIVDTAHVVIDGQSFKAEGFGTLANGKSEKSGTTTIWYLFDIDGDVTIDADESVDLEVVVDLNDTDDAARYPNGATIKASITSTETDEWDAEGADDLENNQFDGTAVGDVHTLVAEGILVPVDGFSSEVDTLGQNDTIGEFTLEFEVTAVEDDFYITEGTSSTTPAAGVKYTVDGGAAVISASLTSTADEDSVGVFTVREGETETFTLVVTVDPTATGTFRVSLNEVWYSADTDGTTGAEVYYPTPVSDFRTSSQAIQGS